MSEKSSRERAQESGHPMEPKTDKTKAVDAGKSAGNPTGQQAKAEGREAREGEKNPNLPNGQRGVR